MSFGIEGSRRIYSLQKAYKRLVRRSPFTTRTASKPRVVIDRNPHVTLVDDLLLKILCLCDISIVLIMSRVRFKFLNNNLFHDY